MRKQVVNGPSGSGDYAISKTEILEREIRFFLCQVVENKSIRWDCFDPIRRAKHC